MTQHDKHRLAAELALRGIDYDIAEQAAAVALGHQRDRQLVRELADGGYREVLDGVRRHNESTEVAAYLAEADRPDPGDVSGDPHGETHRPSRPLDALGTSFTGDNQ